jgi:molybdopterin molybdotransferase
MLEEAEARARILEEVDPGTPEWFPLESALGLRAASGLRARVALPGFDNAQMDGFAVRSGDVRPESVLRVVGTQPAGGDLRLRVGPGEAVRIFTGAPLPEGADAVVMQEDVEVLPDASGIRVRGAVASGEFVRRRGADLCSGQIVVGVGECLTPPRIGLLASQGWDRVLARPAPKVAVVTTGDELVNPGQVPPEALGPGMLFNSNGPMLAAGLRAFGAREVLSFLAPDDPARLRSVLESALSGYDFCLVAGGVSVGDRDGVRDALRALGVEGSFRKVRVKPGKPFFFGTRDGTAVFGLPGNPVSAWVTFLLFVVSALERRMGGEPPSSRPALPTAWARAGAPLANSGDRPLYVRGWHDPEVAAFRPVGLQESHALFGLSRSNALVRVEPGMTIEAGREITVFLMGPGHGRVREEIGRSG